MEAVLLAQLGALLPEAVKDWQPLCRLLEARLGERARKDLGFFSALGEKADAFFLENVGAVEYRAGNYGAAQKTLQVSVQKLGGGGSLEVNLFLAMTHFRLNEHAKAKEHLARAVALIQLDQAATGRSLSQRPPTWYEKLRRQILRREAEELIGGN